MIGLIPALGCTAPNPAFGEGTGSMGGDATGGDATGGVATMTTTGNATVPESTTDPDGTASTVGPEGTSTEDSTTGTIDRHCCGEDDCSDPVRECVCDLGPLICCDGGWTPACSDVVIACGGSCGGEVFPCCVPRPGPACSGVALIPGFCLANPECCLTEWGPACVNAYDAATGECGLVDCGLVHGTPGCDDPDIAECVCTTGGMPQCCTEAWDSECVAAVSRIPC
jgi:hypothetical protein